MAAAAAVVANAVWMQQWDSWWWECIHKRDNHGLDNLDRAVYALQLVDAQGQPMAWFDLRGKARCYSLSHSRASHHRRARVSGGRSSNLDAQASSWTPEDSSGQVGLWKDHEVQPRKEVVMCHADTSSRLNVWEKQDDGKSDWGEGTVFRRLISFAQASSWSHGRAFEVFWESSQPYHVTAGVWQMGGNMWPPPSLWWSIALSRTSSSTWRWEQQQRWWRQYGSPRRDRKGKNEEIYEWWDVQSLRPWPVDWDALWPSRSQGRSRRILRVACAKESSGRISSKGFATAVAQLFTAQNSDKNVRQGFCTVLRSWSTSSLVQRCLHYSWVLMVFCKFCKTSGTAVMLVGVIQKEAYLAVCQVWR